MAQGTLRPERDPGLFERIAEGGACAAGQRVAGRHDQDQRIAPEVGAQVGMAVGQELRERMSEALLRRCVVGGLLLLGAWLALA